MTTSKYSNIFSAIILVVILLIGFSCGQVKNKKSHISVKDYKEYINSLDTTQLNSITKALDKIKLNFGNISKEKTDSLFIVFRRFYHKEIIEWSNNSTKLFNENYLNPKSEKVKKLKDSLSTFGVTIRMSEGIYYANPLPDFLKDNFSKNVSEAVSKYIVQRAHEEKEGFAEDASLIISPKDLLERTVFWEKYIQQFPNSSMINFAIHFYNIYLNVFTLGLDNSSVIEPNGNLSKEYLSAYEYCLINYPNTRTGKVILQELNLLKSKDSHKIEKIMIIVTGNQIQPREKEEPYSF